MLNCIVLMGRFTADPELKHTPNNTAITEFGLAVDRSYVKSGQERQTDFIDIVAWRSTAEFICKHFKKGQLAVVQGSLQIRSYTDKDGIKRRALADSIYFAGSKKETETNKGSQPDNLPENISPESSDFLEMLDDDLPFYIKKVQSH